MSGGTNDFRPPERKTDRELFSRPYVAWLRRQLARRRAGLPVEPPPGAEKLQAEELAAMLRAAAEDRKRLEQLDQDQESGEGAA